MLAELISPTELANMLGITTGALANNRSAGKGPRYVKLGKQVFYRRTDVQAWIDANVRQSTCETVAA
ncbi:helix-turn-helix transcriptional regulator [Bradyrhizobium sp. RDM4]|uniref:helix-turn-helix transcriptional regulator n=1 Tax=Bradyrhizobium sp. RDM4 TaxID=3378765 RepID=UPI0038FC671B